MMRYQIQCNAWLVLVNYPLTIVTQVFSRDEKMFYILEIIVMAMLKVRRIFIACLFA